MPRGFTSEIYGHCLFWRDRQGDAMFGNIFRNNKNERICLVLATVIFALIGSIQLWRAFAGTALDVGGQSVPLWISAAVGLFALFMAFWMGTIVRRHRPLI